MKDRLVAARLFLVWFACPGSSSRAVRTMKRKKMADRSAAFCTAMTFEHSGRREKTRTHARTLARRRVYLRLQGERAFSWKLPLSCCF